MVIIRHNCRLYRIPVFIAIIPFFGWIVNVCEEAHVSLVLPHHSCQVTPGPYSNVTTFQSQCLGFEVLGHTFSMWPTCPTTENFLLGQVVIQVRGRKKVVHVQFMAKSFYHPCQYSHCSMGCCQVLCLPLSVFTKVNIHVICISCRVAQFEHFDAKTFVFFWGMCCLKTILPVNFTMTSYTAKCLKGL